MKVERHSEIVRQWRILVALESHARGVTLAEIREAAGDPVTERTIRRDLDALAQAGFPIDTTRVDGKTRYSLNRDVYRGLSAAGFTLPELCALYLSRTMLGTLAGAPFQENLESAFTKLTDALPASLWHFIDRLPQAFAAKGPGAAAARETDAQRAAVDVLVQAILGHQRVRMRYHSFSSRREKDYLLEPYRLAYAQGGLYLFAFVPEYGEMRTFAMQRLSSVVMLEERFQPVQELDGAAFPHALGAFMGQPEAVVVVFSPTIAPYIREREWHRSQQIEDLADGGIRVHLHVAIDWSLQSWLLGFGGNARVEAPAHLAERIAREAEAVLRGYAGT